MNFNFSEKQKTLMVSALLAVLIAIAALAGYQLNVTPAPTQGIEFGADAVSPIKFANIRVDGTSWLRGAVTAGSTLDMGTNIISNIGNAGTDFNTSGGLTLANGLTVSAGSVSLPAGSIGIGAVADISRTVTIPLTSFVECTTDAGADINYTSGVDASPDFINSATNGLGFTLTFDATGGSPDTEYVCGNLMVPQDFSATATPVFVIRATKGAETGANSEVINCAGSINGAALGTAGTVTTSGTASAAYTCAPTLTSLAAGNALSFEFHITSGGTADDAVNFQSVEFRYSATQ